MIHDQQHNNTTQANSFTHCLIFFSTCILDKTAQRLSHVNITATVVIQMRWGSKCRLLHEVDVQSEDV